MNKRVLGVDKYSAENCCQVTESNAYEHVNNPIGSVPRSALYSFLCTIFTIKGNHRRQTVSLFYTLELTKIQLLVVLGVSVLEIF